MNPESLDISLGDGAAIAVPSGQMITLIDIIWNSEGPDGPTPRFRFLAPAIARKGGTIGIDTAEGDFEHLCAQYVLPALAARQITATQVLISMADRNVDFGAADPDATQFVDVFQIDGPTCIREIF